MRARSNLFIVTCGLIILAVTSIGAHAWFGKPAKTDTLQPTAACCAAQAQATGTPVPLAVTTFTAPGMRGALETALANKNRGRQTITCTTVNQGQEKLETLEVVLLAFTPEGTLARAEGRLLRLGINSGAKRSASFTTELAHDPTHTLTLAVKSATSETKKQEIEARELIEELAKNKATGANPQVKVEEKTKDRTAFVPNACYESFRLGQEIARRNGKLTVSGSLCDQYRQAFSIAFAPVTQK